MFAELKQIIETRLGSFTGCPVVWENTEKARAGTWIRPTSNVSKISESIGQNPIELWAGMLMVQIFIPTGASSWESMKIADNLNSLFERLDTTHGRVRLIVDELELVPVGSADGFFLYNWNARVRAWQTPLASAPVDPTPEPVEQSSGAVDESGNPLTAVDESGNPISITII